METSILGKLRKARVVHLVLWDSHLRGLLPPPTYLYPIGLIGDVCPYCSVPQPPSLPVMDMNLTASDNPFIKYLGCAKRCARGLS